MQDRLSRAVHQTQEGDSHDSNQEAPSCAASSSNDVLGILEDIESQFDRLRTIRSDQVDSLRELKERSARLVTRENQLTSDQAQLETMKAQWEEQVKRDRVQFEDSRRGLESERRAHDRRVDEDKAMLARDRDTLKMDRERLSADQESQRHALKMREDELELGLRELATERADLEILRSRLDEQAEQFSREQEHLVSALVVARRLVDKRGRQLRLQEHRINRVRSFGVKSRTRRRGLESCIRSQRRTIEQLESDRDRQDERLNEAGRRLQGFMERLREQGDLVERGNTALALVDSLESQIETLQATIERDQARVDAGQIAELKTIEDERDSLLERMEHQERQIRVLEEKLSDDSGQMESSAMDDQKARLADIACHLHRRRERLRFVRDRIADRNGTPGSMDSHEARSHQLRQSEVIEKRQLELDEVSRMLGESERRMIRKWAAPRSIVVTCWILLGLSILAVASWLAADRITPAIRGTSITLAPLLQKNEVMNEHESAVWQTMHQEQIVSDGFIRDIAQRAAARRLIPWTTYESVQRLMNDHLTLDVGQPGVITLTLASDQPDKASAFLEIVAGNMVVDAQRSLGSRPGGHGSRMMEGRTEGRVLKHARLNPSVIRDERMITAGVVLAGGILVVSMMLCLVYSRLLRAKRVFDQEHSSALDTRSIRPI